MDETRKYCKNELPKGCLDCEKEDGFGDICHAYQAYHEGYENALKDIRNAMTFHQSGLSGYFTISQDEWEQLEGKM